ncbi:MAG: Gx transporter family protein [Parasporobacterium sp.]|nr:Gx transporter family protein [Parasporobacterium sp.]
MIFSYVESLIPFHFGVPGIKLGLANLVIVTGLYLLRIPDLCLVALIRIVVSGLLFGNIYSLIYSLAGGACSLLIMLLLKKTGKFSVYSISIAGGVFHNLGQIAAAAAVTRIPVLLYYLPVLMGAGMITGALIGVIASRVLKIFFHSSKQFLH